MQNSHEIVTLYQTSNYTRHQTCWNLIGWATRTLTAIIIWLAPWAGEMNQILRSDWLPERARWSYLARSGLTPASCWKLFRATLRAAKRIFLSNSTIHLARYIYHACSSSDLTDRKEMQSFSIPLLACCINSLKARLLYWIKTSRGSKDGMSRSKTILRRLLSYKKRIRKVRPG